MNSQVNKNENVNKIKTVTTEFRGSIDDEIALIFEDVGNMFVDEKKINDVTIPKISPMLLLLPSMIKKTQMQLNVL